MRGRAGHEGLIPLDTCPLHYISVTPAELINLNESETYVFTSTRSAACLCSPAPAVPSPPEQICRTSICLADATAQCSNSAEFCTEQTGSQVTKNITSGYFSK